MSGQYNTKLFNLKKMFGSNALNVAINIDLKNSYVYVENPKVASSTVKRHLMRQQLLTLPGAKTNPHPEIQQSPFVKPYQLGNDQLGEILFGPGYYKFSFVRNPFSRVLSAFLDKIEGKAPESKLFFNWVSQDKSRAIDFKNFVAFISQQQPHTRDKHWSLQRRNIFFEFIRYEMVGRLESFNHSIQVIQQNSGIDFSDIKTHSPHKTDASSKLRNYYDEGTRERVVEIYSEDFKSFNYQTDIE